jgi:hypothetical protein
MSRSQRWTINLIVVFFVLKWIISDYTAETIYQQICYSLDFIGAMVGICAFAYLHDIGNKRAAERVAETTQNNPVG